MSESQTDEMIDQQIQELAERLFLGGVAAFELMTIHLGTELGLYAALAGSDGATPPELAAATAIHPRYAQEWLEQQAAAGLIDVDDVAEAPEARLFRLPAPHAEVLLREESLFYTAPIAVWSPRSVS